MNEKPNKKRVLIPLCICILAGFLIAGLYFLRKDPEGDRPSQGKPTVQEQNDPTASPSPSDTEVGSVENPAEGDAQTSTLIPYPETESPTEPGTVAPTTVAPTAPPADGLTVTFLAPDDSLLYVDVVSPGEPAQAPINPVMPIGYAFSYWDTDFSHVTTDLTVRAVCTQIPTDRNVFAAQGYYVTQGENTSVSIRLCGKVCLCLCNLKISYDPTVLEFVEFRGVDGGADANCLSQSGEIYLNYASLENTEGEVDLANIVFRAIGAPGQYPVQITVTEADAYDTAYNFIPQNCAVIPATVTIAHGE